MVKNPSAAFSDKLLDLSGIVLITIGLSLLSFIWEGHKGFGLSDEGFLWYGAQRVMMGEVPIRDFMAYDPGRYYWLAALMTAFGDNGIISLRIATTAFQTLGLFAGLLLISRPIRNPNKENLLFLILSALTLMIWMFPYYKVFDISLSILLIAALTFLVQNPSARGYFVTGIFIGLIAVFGRNHGVYGFAGSLGVMVWLRSSHTETAGFITGFALLTAGCVIGFAPIILMALFIPGFAAAFWESILSLFEQQATNLLLPVPWPWTVDFAALPLHQVIRDVLIGLFFMGTLIFGGLAIVWALFRTIKNKFVPPELVASAFLALPYAHYSYSRADIAHLALGIYPLLIGCLALLAAKQVWLKWSLALTLCVASFMVMLVYHSGWQCRASKQCVTVQISGSTIQTDSITANDIALIRHLAAQYAPNGQNFITTPFWPGAYSLLEQASPMWDIYPLLHRSEAFEQREIERIQTANPGFALIVEIPLDGHNELRFSNAHPLIYQYIQHNFDPLPNSPNPDYQIYIARSFEQ